MSFDQVDNKMRADGDGFFNYFIMDLKSDGRHSKQATPPTVATETNTNIKLLQNLVQPYLLAFKQAIPSYARVPTKEDPFNPSFYANKIIKNNCYPESCDVINNVEQGPKLSNTYEREKTGRVRSFC